MNTSNIFFSISSLIEEGGEVLDSAMVNAVAPIKERLGLLKSISSNWLETFISFGLRVILALVCFLIGRLVIKYLIKLIDKIMHKKQLDGVAITLLNSILVVGFYIVLFVVLAEILGFQSVSFAAILASMGLAVGMALSGQLQNLAGGVIILFTKPFKIGDFIQAQSVEGFVSSVTLFHTQIMTPDNKMVFVPNGILSSGVVTNFSHAETRRLQWIIGVEYGQDFEAAKNVILELFQTDKRILQTPEPLVVLHELASSSVNIMCRVWVLSDNYWNVYFDINKRIYAEFNKRGIGFPFPQLTIHQAKN